MLCLLAVAACGGSKQEGTVPGLSDVAQPEPGWMGLARCVGEEVEAVAEVDVHRLRSNQVVGPLFDRLKLPVDARHVGQLVVGFYRVGTADAATVFWLRGETLDATKLAAELPDAEALDEHTLAVGPAERRACDGGGPSNELRALRDDAEPPAAPGTSVRVYAMLNAGARGQIASLYGLNDFPSRLSLWIDVVDDAALIALYDGEAEVEARLTDLGVGRVRTEPTKDGTKLVWVVGPRELRKWVRQADRIIERVP